MIASNADSRPLGLLPVLGAEPDYRAEFVATLPFVSLARYWRKR